MSIPAVRKLLDRGSGVDRTKQNHLGQPLEIVENRIEVLGLNVLQHIDTGHHLGRYWRLVELLRPRIVSLVSDLVRWLDVLVKVEQRAATVVE